MKLHWYVYRENINKRKIERYNVLNDGFVSQVKKRIKQCDIRDKRKFEEHVEQLLMNNYWCRAEHEVVVTKWPPHITNEELARLNVEQERHLSEYGAPAYCCDVRLNIAEKIDIYDQVMLNWKHFINYFWSELNGNS